MKTLIKTDEFGKVTKAFYTDEQSATDAANSFLRDCRVHGLQRDKRSTEIVDFDYQKYGFSKMPIFAQFEANNLGLFVKVVFNGLGNQRFTVTNQVNEL
jgi:hypothetical protein